MKSSTKRRRRTAAQIAQLERQILEVLEADHPQSVRHCFYRLTDPRLPEPVEKSEAGYRQVQQRLVEMRRAGRIPFGWITDATRRGFHVRTFKNAGTLIMEHASLFRADLWRFASIHVLITHNSQPA